MKPHYFINNAINKARIGNALSVLILLVKFSNSSSAGGINDFTHQDSTYFKWVLNRSLQARMVDSLLSLAGIDKKARNPRKCLRGTQIKNSEDQVMKVVEALKGDFINPFVNALDRLKLFNLVSGKLLPNVVAELLISAEARGRGLQLQFNKGLDSGDESGVIFFNLIKRVKWKSLTVLKRKRK